LTKKFQSLTPREHVRFRPGMYIGGRDKQALHHLIYEVLDNSVESAFVNACDEITIRLQPDNQVTISDNDRSLPAYIASRIMSHKLHMPEIDAIMTQVGYQFKDVRAPYKVHGGVHGLGLQVVNCLTSSMKVEVAHKGTVWKRAYREGLPIGAIQRSRQDEVKTGITFTFQPDFTILEENNFEFDRVAKRCEDVVYNTPGLKISIFDERTTPHREKTVFSAEGLKTLVEKLNEGKTPLHDTIHTTVEVKAKIENQSKNFFIEFALQYTDSDETIIRSYVNTVPNEQGGTHVNAMQSVITSGVNGYFRDTLPEFGRNLSWREIKKGLTLAIGIRHPDPIFESPTQTRLLLPELDREIKNTAMQLFSPDLSQELYDHFAVMID